MFLRRGDSIPLDSEDAGEWFEMQRSGRARYVTTRTALIVANMVGPVALSLWTAWWVAPGSREFILGPTTWIALGIGTILVGSLGAAHSWDTWRSFEKRSELDPPPTIVEHVAHLQDRVARVTLRVAVVSTLPALLAIFTRSPAWMVAITVFASLSCWRGALMNRRAMRKLQRSSMEAE